MGSHVSPLSVSNRESQIVWLSSSHSSLSLPPRQARRGRSCPAETWADMGLQVRAKLDLVSPCIVVGQVTPAQLSLRTPYYYDTTSVGMYTAWHWGGKPKGQKRFLPQYGYS